MTICVPDYDALRVSPNNGLLFHDPITEHFSTTNEGTG